MTDGPWITDDNVAALPNAGAVADSAQADYFGFDETHRAVFPDGVSYLVHRSMNEGARRKFLAASSKDVKIQRGTGDMSLKMAAGEDREALFLATVEGWNLVRAGVPVPFSKSALQDFIAKANPKVLDHVEKQIRTANPWLLADMSVEDIDREIENLNEMRALKVQEEAGKGA